MINEQNSTFTSLIDPVAMTNGETQAATLDCKGADYATVRITMTKGSTGTVASADGATFRLASSDVTHTSSFVTVTADRTAIKLTQTGTYLVDMKTKKRYLRASAITGTSGVSNENATVAIHATLSRLESAPTATNDMTTGNTNDAVTIV